MVDIVGYKASTGASGTIKSAANVTFNYDVSYIDLTMILDPPDIATRVRGWFANYPYFNGYHLSNQYSVRVYLDEGQTKSVNLQSGTSRDINNLLNGQFITLDTLLSISLTREEFTPEDSDSTVIIDSDYITPDSDIIFGVDSTGALRFGSRITLQDWIIGQDSATGGFNITYKNTNKDVLQLDQTGVLDVDSAINGGDF